MRLPVFEQDKLLHFTYGSAAASAASAAAVALMPVTPLEMVAAAFGAAATAGLAKEAYDWWDNRRRQALVHQVAWADLMATVLGATPVGLPFFIIGVMLSNQ